MSLWRLAHKADPVGAKLADGHYSRRKVGSPQFMPPGETLVLVTHDESAVFGWWRPHPASGLRSMNGLDGWTCSIFRYVRGERRMVASTLILEAEAMLVAQKGNCGPDGLLTYVWDAKVRSGNPGYCFKRAWWSVFPCVCTACNAKAGLAGEYERCRRRSADGKKTLLWKAWNDAGARQAA